jgi:beta-lactamase superfamily II metal-dependent hydrolase
MTQLDDIGKVLTAVAGNQLRLSDPAFTTSLQGIRVFDVGQGDCIGLLDQHKRVFCYIDFGGLGDHPDRLSTAPNPSATRLSVNYLSQLTTIVLTHWDKDHYYSAKRYNTNAQQCQWLAPRQLASPQAVKFAANLTKAYCWPAHLGQSTRKFPVGADHDIEIRKCQPFNANATQENRNHTGLAVTLWKKDRGQLKTYMLLPGDCHFDGIPHLPPGVPIHTLIAYHHGSRTDFTPATSQEVNNPRTHPGVLAYSYGQNNTYRHPRKANYQPTWDPPTLETPNLRAARISPPPSSQDFIW